MSETGKTALITLCLALVLVTTSESVHARERDRRSDAHRQYVARGGASLDEAVRRVRAETGGRVLSAETVRRNGHAVHRIKVLLPSGHVRIVHIDADRN